MRYSVVVPLFDEAENLSTLYQQLKSVMDSLKDSYELIFVNDGSQDQGLSILQKLQSQDKKILIINSKTNRGQSRALQTGFDKSCGEIVITLDADMQNSPADIPLLLNRLKQGYDLVCGWRRKRRDNFSKKVVSRLGNICQRLLLHAPVHDTACSLRVLRQACLKELRLEGKGLHCFIPFIFQQKGYKISEVVVRHRPRIAGRSKYPLLRQILEVLRAFFYLRQRL